MKGRLKQIHTEKRNMRRKILRVRNVQINKLTRIINEYSIKIKGNENRVGEEGMLSNAFTRNIHLKELL